MRTAHFLQGPNGVAFLLNLFCPTGHNLYVIPPPFTCAYDSETEHTYKIEQKGLIDENMDEDPHDYLKRIGSKDDAMERAKAALTMLPGKIYFN